jgi:predicted HicB family RNase H-like nuclease
MTDIRVSVPVDKGKKDFWQEVAKNQGISFSDFVREALDFRASCDPSSFLQMKAQISESAPSEAMIVYRTTATKKKILDQTAKLQEMSLNEYVDSAIAMRLAWPREAYEEVRKIAANLHLPMSHVILHKIGKQLAWEYAWLKVFGKPAPSTGTEFRFEGNRLVTGDELIDQLAVEFKKILTDAKVKLQSTSSESEHFSTKELESVFAGLKSEIN